MAGHLIVEVAGSFDWHVAFQLMAPAVEKAIQVLLIAALPVGGCLGWLTGEVIRRANITNRHGVIYHLLNALTGTVGFLFGAYISLQRGSKGSVLAFPVLSSVAFVLVVRFCIYILVHPAKIQK